MAEGIAFSILEKIGEYLVAPIGRQFRYLFCYNNNIENLRDQAKNIEDIKEGVQLSVVAAKNNLEVIAPHVQSWLTNVDKIKTESDRIFKDKGFVDKGCLNGWCPNLKSRYLLSREASKKAQVIVELLSKGNQFTKFSHSAPPVGTVASTSAGGSKGLQSRTSMTKEIANALKNDNIAMIGICGMGGIGKTTMVEEISKRARSENNLDEFAMAVVSQTKDVIKIQGQLAEMLGLKFEGQTSSFARAQRLRQRLTNGSRILVILDDVWEAFDMAEIGIPIGDERKGCKVALTSRSELVCSQMGTQKNFSIEVLSEKEAWDLFKEIAGSCVDTDDVRRIAQEVAKECGGLPLALVTVAKALQNKKKYVWDDALQQLRKSTVTNITGMHKLVYSRIELSYNYLESEQAKSLLLLCCLFQEDENIPIELLVRYAVGLEVFEDLDTLAETRKRVYSLVDELRSNYLLLGEGTNAFVKMHDVVRDAGISIASKGEHEYMVRHDTSLKEWPQKDTHSPHTAISLYSNEIQELPASLDFPNLKLLRLVCRHKNLEISRDFFEGMKELKVITFGVEYINSLPTSFMFLLNLRTLCLENFKFLGNLSLIGGLQKLEILSFFNCDQVVLPSEMGELGNLKLLDLRSRCFTKIPVGVLSRLRKLEELFMGVHFLQNENCASLIELTSLSGLKRLQIMILASNEYLPKLKDFHFQNLTEYNFSMCDDQIIGYLPTYELEENCLFFNRVDKIVILENNINVLFRGSKKLVLITVGGLKNVVKDLDEEEGFGHLESLEIRRCHELEYVMDAEICHGSLLERSFERHSGRGGPIQPPPLGNLRFLILTSCKTIKCLFKNSVVKCLVQLQLLEIRYCDMIEGIVLEEGGEDKIVLPGLSSLVLETLPKFRSFMRSTGETKDNNLGGSENIDNGQPPTQPLFNQQVLLLPNMKILEVRFLVSIHHVLIKGDQMQDGSLYNLQDLTVYSCKSLKAIFDFEGMKFGKAEHAEVTMLSRLESVRLRSLHKLTHIWRMVPKGIQGFHNLTSLLVKGCSDLRYIFSPSVAKMVVNLQELSLGSCPKVEHVIKMEEEEEDSSEIEMMDKMVLPRLQILELEFLENLTVFCGQKHDLELPLLEKLCIRKCPNMKSFCSGYLNAPKLDRVYLERYVWNEWVWKGDLNSLKMLKRAL